MNVNILRNSSDGTVVLTLDADAAAALSLYLDGVDIADIHSNPGYHGYSSDQANAIAAALSALRHPLNKATSQY